MALASMAAFSRHGVHEGQQFVLSCLWEEDGLTPGEVAKQLRIATSTVTTGCGGHLRRSDTLRSRIPEFR
jgi:hypothetical protein